MRKRVTLGRIGRVAMHVLAAAAAHGRLHTRNIEAVRRMRERIANLDDSLLADALETLRKRGAIARRGDSLSLTPAGTRLARARALGVEKIPSPERWDGTWCVVTFDVPGCKSPERDAIRGNLRALGFCQLQKSVYAHPSSFAGKTFAKIAARMGAERRIALLTHCEVDGDQPLRKEFGL